MEPPLKIGGEAQKSSLPDISVAGTIAELSSGDSTLENATAGDNGDQ
jgi:hypothetical protein